LNIKPACASSFIVAMNTPDALKNAAEFGDPAASCGKSSGQSALCGVVDPFIVQRSNAGLIDLPDRVRNSIIEAFLPNSLSGQLAPLQRRAHAPGCISQSRIKHLGALFRVKVQVTVADDGRKRLRRLGRLDFAAQRGTTESEEAGRHNRGRKQGPGFVRSFHGYLLM
jgi:hypothetical protein